MNRSTLIADPWYTPILLFTWGPYCPCVLVMSSAFWCHRLMCRIISTGRPFLYQVAHGIVRLMVSKARDRSMSSRFVASVGLPMYDSVTPIASIADRLDLYPYCVLLVAICIILVSLGVMMADHIL